VSFSVPAKLRELHREKERVTHTGSRIASRQITTWFSLQFRYNLVISTQSYKEMKNGMDISFLNLFFKIEIEHLEVMIQVIL